MAADITGVEYILLRPERLKNLSDSQSFKILDLLLNKALQPLCATTNVVQEWICELMPLIWSDKRRKVSIVERLDLINLGLACVFTQSPRTRFKLVKKMKLERSLLFGFLWKIFSVAESYEDYQLKHCTYKDPHLKSHFAGKMTEIETRLGSNRDNLSPALRQSLWWSNQAKAYKSMIAEKYYKLAWREVNKAIRGTAIHVDAEELFKNYTMAITRAIDKFSAERGVLASYIAQWFKDANINSEFDHQYGTSYSIPNSRRRSLQKSGWIDSGVAEQNMSVGIEDENVKEKLPGLPDNYFESHHAQQRLKMLSVFPEIKLVMLLNGINYPLSDKELALQRATLDVVK